MAHRLVHAATMPVRSIERCPSSADSEVLPPWVKDHEFTTCMRCRAPFKFLRRRRHHCRRCGHLVCSSCSKGRQLVPSYHPKKHQRVCYSCESDPADSTDGSVSVWTPKRSSVALSSDDASHPLGSGGPSSRNFAVLNLRVVEARGLIASDCNVLGKRTKSDPYCIIRFGDSEPVRTKTVPGTVEPCWDEEVRYRVSRREDLLRIHVWDEDTGNADDHLGSIELSLADLHADASPLRGWIPLDPPEGHRGAAGALFLELQLTEFCPRLHFLACVAPLRQSKSSEKRPADLASVQRYFVRIVNVAWTKFAYPNLISAWELMSWKDPSVSLSLLCLWMVASYFFLIHLPTVMLVALGLYPLRRFRVRRGTSKPKKRLGSFDETQDTLLRSMNEGVQAMLLMSDDMMARGRTMQRLRLLPSWVETLLRAIVPLLHALAECLELTHDLFVWKHPNSPLVAILCLAAAAMWELALLGFMPCISLNVHITSAGCFILLAFSPVATAFLGVLRYFWWRYGPQDPTTWDMHADYQSQWDFVDL
eukprot:TRINITY_DN33345_c0_g1_i1.p1 TRINITY_DN33345_c0_g1~~TRINITY_DN33345_c0_g1_i1.p1  ORF type:complete len:559 (-),score=38.91 TRINITY_DN33345_c0_g1_i1:342-1946(-)